MVSAELNALIERRIRDTGATPPPLEPHDHGAARLPGIHFLGLRWLTDRKSALLFAAASESAAAVQRIAD